MSYTVLARKWRPRAFAEMVGQSHVVRALANALEHDRLHHAYLFTGTRGVGKTTVARILAKSLNCETGVTAEPCGECGACREIDEGRFVDLLEVDAASKTGVDDTRDLLDNVPYAPVRGRYKVYLIDEVHMFSGHSFNALLKTLEEPPPHVKFLLATTDPQKVPVTVLSRCLQFNLKRLPLEEIEGQLRHILAAEGVECEPPALALLARAADGSMRDGLSLLDQAIAFGGGGVTGADVQAMLGVVAGERLPALLGAVDRGDATAALQLIREVAEYAPDFGGLLRELVTLLHRVAVVQQVPDAAQPAWGDVAAITGLAEAIPPDEVQLYYQIALHGQRDLPLAPDERSGFEMLILRLLAFRPASAAPVAVPPVAVPAQASSVAAGTASDTRPEGAAEPVAAPAKTDAAPADSGDAGPPKQAGVQADVSQLFDDWDRVVREMSLKGMAAQLARNAVVAAWDGRRLALSVDPGCASLLGSVAEDKLASALTAYAACDLVLELKPGSAATETPAQRDQRIAAARQADTEASIERDPFVLAAQDIFDAEIVPDSIRRLD